MKQTRASHNECMTSFDSYCQTLHLRNVCLQLGRTDRLQEGSTDTRPNVMTWKDNKPSDFTHALDAHIQPCLTFYTVLMVFGCP